MHHNRDHGMLQKGKENEKGGNHQLQTTKKGQYKHQTKERLLSYKKDLFLNIHLQIFEDIGKKQNGNPIGSTQLILG